MERSGITPVIAVTLLLGMTVAASGGAYAWVSQIQQQAQEDASQGLATRLDVKDVRCDRGAVELAIKNSGDTAIDTASADLYVYGPDDELVAARSDVDLSDLSLGPGAFVSPAFVVPAVLEPGSGYRVELAFERDGASATATCDPRTAALDPVALWTFDDEPDHKPVIIYQDTPALYYMENFENGSFGTLQEFGASYAFENDDGVAMADFDRNGVYDIMFYGQSHNIYVWHDIEDEPPSGAPVKVATLGGSKAQGMAAGDWDEDGDMDVIENQDGDLLENQGNGSWSVTGLPFDGHRDIVGADFDRDGCEDIVYDTGSGSTIDFRAGNCDGTFGSAATVITTPDNDNWLAEGDFDGDGDQDVVVVPEAGDGDADLWTGDGDGTFTLANANFTSFNDGNHRNPAASDLDGDGDLDLIFAEHDDNDVRYVEGNGDGTFQAAVMLEDAGSSVLGSAAPGNDYVLDHASDHDAKRVGPPNWTAGRSDGGALFDGASDYLEVAHDGALDRADDDPFTIALWAKPADTENDNILSFPIQDGQNGNRFHIKLDGDSGEVSLYSSAWYRVTLSPDGTGDWYHVAAVFDGDTLTAYVDGERVGATSVPSDNDWYGTFRFSGDYYSDNSARFNGTVDEVSYYASALH